MTATTRTEQNPYQRLRTVAALLHHAAERQWDQAAQEGPRSIRHSLGLAASLAACQTTNLLPRDVELPASPATGIDPLELLRTAEQLARTVSITPDLPGLSDVVMTIGDVLRETEAHARG